MESLMTNSIQKFLVATLMISTIGTAIATPVQDQAQKLYTALKANKPTKTVYTYCKKHKITPEQIANETKKLCEAKSDWDTYSKVTELEVVWEDRLQSMSTTAKVVATIGTVAGIVCTYFLIKYLRQPAVIAPAPEPNTQPDVLPEPAPVPQPQPAPANRVARMMQNLQANNPEFQRRMGDPVNAQNIRALFDNQEFVAAMATPLGEMFEAQIIQGFNHGGVLAATEQPNFADVMMQEINRQLLWALS